MPENGPSKLPVSGHSSCRRYPPAASRWGAAKCQRIQEKLEATVAGQTNDAEHLLDVLIAAWEEMHREADNLRRDLHHALTREHHAG